jgi:hypothetical protein
VDIVLQPMFPVVQPVVQQALIPIAVSVVFTHSPVKTSF